LSVEDDLKLVRETPHDQFICDYGGIEQEFSNSASRNVGGINHMLPTKQYFSEIVPSRRKVAESIDFTMLNMPLQNTETIRRSYNSLNLERRRLSHFNISTGEKVDKVGTDE